MKVEQKKAVPVFVPVVITLETEEELLELLNTLDKGPGSYALWRELNGRISS